MSSDLASVPGQLLHLALQLLVTIALCRLLAIALRRVGQPPVIADIVAGIVLGPTVLGALSPNAMALLFPSSSLLLLRTVSQIGIVLYMFVVGLDTRPDALSFAISRTHALVISTAGIAIPFALGVAIAPALWTQFGERVPFLPFALFVATAMSITAFPVLARLLADHQMLHSPLGVLALRCAAYDDLAAWLLLAALTLIARTASLAEATRVCAGLLLWAFAIALAPRLLARWRDRMVMPLIFLALSATTAEVVGVHAVFGAFVAGAVVPLDREARERLSRPLSRVALVLMPLFFAWSGLRTDFSSLLRVGGFASSIIILLVATAGKLGGVSLAARFCGLASSDALRLGVLMNTRGLMELVALNIGYDLGLVSRPLFSAFVVMALVTTFSTSPLLRLGTPKRGVDSALPR